MKHLLTIISILTIALKTQAQFFSFDFTAYKTKIDIVGWGLDFNGGVPISKQESKRDIMIGLGAGINLLDGSPAKLYAPVYGQVLYYSDKRKVNPYANIRVGHAFYDGGSRFIEKDDNVKGGLYANIRLGAGLRGHEGFSGIPFIGCSFMRFRHDDGYYNNTFFNAGLSFFFK